MRRGWFIVAVLCVLLASASVFAVARPRAVPLDECSEVYRRYVGRDDINAAYIRDYRINDTVTVAVTTLEAVTDSGWAEMQKIFNLPQIPKEFEQFFYGDSNRITMIYLNKDMAKLALHSGEDPEYLAAVSYYNRSITVFEVNDEALLNIIFRKKILENVSN